MLDVGWPELLVIVAVAVLVIGPDEIPEIARGLGRIMRRLQYVRFALSQQFEDFMQEHDIQEMRGRALGDREDLYKPPATPPAPSETAAAGDNEESDDGG